MSQRQQQNPLIKKLELLLSSILLLTYNNTRMISQSVPNPHTQLLTLRRPASKLLLAAHHHIDSFNYIFREGLNKLLQYLSPMELLSKEIVLDGKQLPLPFSSLKLSFSKIVIGKPFKANDPRALTQQIYPKDCRLMGKTYSAPLICEVTKEIDDTVETFAVNLGELPIMVRSDHCHLANLPPDEMVNQCEDPYEYGGYFIINGNEKIIRMLIIQKRNFPVAFLRPSYTSRGVGYTQFAVQMRCVREDLYARTFTLHYISDGNIYLRLLYKKQEFLIPLIIILKALGDVTDRQIYTRLLNGKFGDSAKSDKVEVLIKTAKNMGYTTREQCLTYLGNSFRFLLSIGLSYSDYQAGQIFLNENICVHLNDNHDKFNAICLMVDKLYALVNSDIEPDNLDALCNHEILLPGHLYLMILREKLEDCLSIVRAKIIKDCTHQDSKRVRESDYIKKVMQSGAVTKQIESFLSTGTLRSKTGLDLMQDKGFTVIADRLNNMRFLSHFRSIHRGAYFAEMKTTTVRKLLPENWGFLCPVHTPDGGPCGLLNHITMNCVPQASEVYDEKKHQNLNKLVCKLGVVPVEGYNYMGDGGMYPVVVDGRHVGYISDTQVQGFVNSLRMLKVKGQVIPKQTQIAWLKKMQPRNTAYPVVFISCSLARMLRPVKFLPLNQIQWISPLQQLFLPIQTTSSLHCQLSPATILSVLPQHIPFLNFNQSPRNMYQCQMAKQTMGTGVLNWDYRYDNKLYRIVTSQLPMVKTKIYEDYGFHMYNSGCNAVVAVISYTGYDMEDAMIINKSSFERGFGHGMVYKTLEYVINKEEDRKRQRYRLWKDSPVDKKREYQLPETVDSDGIVRVGWKLKKGSVVLVLFDVAKNAFKEFKNKDSEPCHVDGVIVTSLETNVPEKVLVKLRFNRRPVIGDKFSSRHGQKGVLSTLWPQIDMPFTENGITPDVIINPNAFPSRMTIGMLIQSMAGKTAALQGKIQQFEPFEVYQNDNVVSYFGSKLLQMGYNYYGNETMYSGIYGNQMKVDIYLGLVYYQRLRHMVSDKSQARSTGPVDILTQQPLKGRKKGGGIRMGQMERDAMLAHGLSQIVNQRLFRSSDYSEAYVCNRCGSVVASFLKIEKISFEASNEVFKETPICRACDAKDCSKISVPYVFKYLANELAAMNIKLTIRLRE